MSPVVCGGRDDEGRLRLAGARERLGAVVRDRLDAERAGVVEVARRCGVRELAVGRRDVEEEAVVGGRC